MLLPVHEPDVGGQNGYGHICGTFISIIVDQFGKHLTTRILYRGKEEGTAIGSILSTCSVWSSLFKYVSLQRGQGRVRVEKYLSGKRRDHDPWKHRDKPSL